MKFIDICAGIGGFRSGLEQAGHECIGYVEIDKYARKSYEAMYDTENEWTETDITKVRTEEIPRADLWCFGFPCQDISVAGRRKGLDGERSGIFYDIINLLKSKRTEDRPEWLLIENVKNLLSVDKGGGFTEVLSEISEAGYDSEWALLNSKDFGVPQNRERVFIIGHLRTKGRRQVLSQTGSDRQTGKEIENKIDTNHPKVKTVASGIHQKSQVQAIDGISKPLIATDYKDPQKIAVPKQIIPGNQAHRVYDSDGISVTVKAEGGGLGAKSGLYAVPEIKTIATGINQREYIQEYTGIARSLTATDYKEPQSIAVPLNKDYGIFEYDGKEYNIRRLTPRECFRLQGFSDEQFDKARELNSDTQLYKQAGNAVTVNVAKYLGELLREVG